jgi:flagellar biogenesis protein FliO
MELGFELLKSLLALIIVLGMLVLVLKYVKGRIMPQRGIIELLHYQALGPKRGLSIVRVAGQYMLIGVGDQSVSLLTKLEAADVAEALKQAAVQLPVAQGTLAERLRSLFGGRNQ